MTRRDESDDDDVWQPPLWPRYVGIGLLLAVLAGCGWLVWIGAAALLTDGGSDVFAAILGSVGAWYVWRELRAAWDRLVEARGQHEPEAP